MENSSSYGLVGEVLKREYIIPKYQRGYRWTKDNVMKLLEDIYEGINVENIENYYKSKKFYCIQPLVVMRNEFFPQKYDVIDGQQRLTTIAIIRAALKKEGELYKIDSPSIFYESRPKSQEFLEKLYRIEEMDSPNDYENNIDYAYMRNAFDISIEYFKKFLSIDIDKKNVDYLDKILCEFTKFIWYEVKNINPQKVFANFNTGKIELTNSELIKALFMNPEYYGESNISDKQIGIAEKWNDMEKQLQNDDFWAFVPHPKQYEKNSEQYSTRIDIIFDFLIMNNWLKENEKNDINDYINYRHSKSSDKYIFYEIEYWIEKNIRDKGDRYEAINKCWREVGEIFSGLKELYSDDNKIYNIVGLYINLNNRNEKSVDGYSEDNNLYLKIYSKIEKILKLSRDEREKKWKEAIKNSVFKNNEPIPNFIKDLDYEKSIKSSIVKVLILYNIAVMSTSKGTGERYNFLANASFKWEREHIFARKLKLEGNIQRKAALKVLSKDYYIDYAKYISNKEFPIEFEYEQKKFELNTDSDSQIIDSFIDFSKNNQDYYMLGKAFKTKKEANKVLEYFNCISKIEQINSEEDSELKKRLAYKYINSFKKTFYYKENVDFKNCEEYQQIKQRIREIKSKEILFDSLKFEFILNYFIDNKQEWEKWLDEYKESDKDEQNTNKTTNLDILVEAIVKKYSDELDKNIYEKNNKERKIKELSSIFDGKRDEFIFASLNLNKATFLVKIKDFFENEFTKLLEDNTMGNMTLLTGSNNRERIDCDMNSLSQNISVSNKTYYEKKRQVYEFFKQGQFVPLGTLLVFTGIYTKEIITINDWLPNSRHEYLKDIIDTIQSFLEIKEGD